MKTQTLIATAGALLAAVSVSAASSAPQSSPLVERGRHIVEEVSLCVDCHTPRLPTGQLDAERALMGSPLGFKALMEMPWAPVAPSLVDRDPALIRQVLTTGNRPDGSAPLPPMPSFRLSADEAAAVVAYLQSLSQP